MTLRANISDLQREAGRAVPASWGPLWLVVGWPERASKARSGFRRRGFTLIELLLVLALLAMAVALAAPSLSRFFQGRALDSEGRRLLALTRYAQSRAVSEGIPMVLWLNPDTQSYGLRAEITYTGEDPEAVTYELDSNLAMELPPAVITETVPWKMTTEIAGVFPPIRFTPDGFIDENSPEWVWLKVTREGMPDAVWITLTENRLNYELQDTEPVVRR